MPAVAETIRFPQIKNVLWDRTPQSSCLTVHVTQYKNLKIEISSQVLRLAHRHVINTANSYYLTSLNGSLISADDGYSTTLLLDRFDLNSQQLPDVQTPGDLRVPFQVLSDIHSNEDTISSYTESIKILSDQCQSKSPIDTSSFLQAHAVCHFTSSSNAVTFILNINVILPAMRLSLTLITPIPMVQTALSKNLSGPLSISSLQGEPKSGYLTMDHTRKLLLVLETDPKVYSLPLVGIWVSGVDHVYSMYIWACCLRYLHNSHIQDRVCKPPEAFLLVFYSPTHTRPHFYEVLPTPPMSPLTFSLHTALLTGCLPQASDADPIELEASPVESGPKADQFDVALYNAKHYLKDSKKSSTQKTKPPTSTFNADDIIPRVTPIHPASMPQKESLVPDISIFVPDSHSQADPAEKYQVQQPAMPSSTIWRSQVPQRHSMLPGPRAPSKHMQQNGLRELNHRQVIQEQPVKFSYGNSEKNTPLHRPPNMVARRQGPVYNTQDANSVVQNTNYNSSNIGLHRQVPHERVMQTNIPRVRQPNMTLITQQSRQTEENYRFQSHVTQGNQYNSVASHNVRIPLNNQSDNPGVTRRNCVTRSAAVPVVNQAPPHNVSVQHTVSNVQNHTRTTGNRMSVLSHHMSSQPRPLITGSPQIVHSPNIQSVSSISQAPNVAVNCNNFQATNVKNKQFTVVTSSYDGFSPQDVNTNEVDNNTISDINKFNSNLDQVNREFNHLIGSQEHIYTLDGLQGGNAGSVMNQQPTQIHSYSTPILSHVQAGVQDASTEAIRLSRDSGVGITPKSSPVVETSIRSIDDIHAADIQPQVYQLLLQQDAQLKQLQAQIQQLLARSSPSSPHRTDSYINSSSETTKSQITETYAHQNTQPVVDVIRGANSVAVNTSFDFGKGDYRREVSIQTSPTKVNTPSVQRVAQLQNNSSSQDHSFTTPSELRHTGVVRMNSSPHSGADGDADPTMCNDLTLIMNDMSIHNESAESEHSQMMLDMPSFVASSSSQTNESQDTKSPPSASMVVEDEEQEVFGSDQVFQMMANIRSLLRKHETNDSAEETTRQNQQISQLADITQYNDIAEYMQEPPTPNSRLYTERRSSDTTFIPKINYMSMFLDSDTDTSLEINALAMKYLKDDQLTQLAKLRLNTGIKNMAAVKNDNLLRQILKGSGSTPTPDVTQFGMAATDMTMATKNFLQRHGLCDVSGRGDFNDENEFTTQRDSSIQEDNVPSELYSSYLDVIPQVQTSKPHQVYATNIRNNPIDNSRMNTDCNSYGIRHNSAPLVNTSHTSHASANSSNQSDRISVHSNQSNVSNPSHHSGSSGLSYQGQGNSSTPSFPSQNHSQSEEKVLDIARLRQLPKLL